MWEGREKEWKNGFSTLSTEFSTSLSPRFRLFVRKAQGKDRSNLCEIFCKFVAFSAIQRYNVMSKQI